MATYQGIHGIERVAVLLGTMPEKLRKADKTAQWRAAKKSKVVASTRIRKNLNLKKPYVDSKLSIRRIQENEVHLEAERRGVLMTRFPHTPVFRSRKGVKQPAGYRVRITKQGGSVRMRHVFPIRLRAGKVAGVHVGLAHNIGGKVEVLHAPSVSQALDALLEEIAGPVTGHYADFLEQEIGRL